MFAATPGIFIADTQALVLNAVDFGLASSASASQNDRAMAAAIAAVGRGTIFIPAGVYKCSGFALSNLTDVSLTGAGTGSILAPIANATALTITNCIRCHVHDLKIDGSINGGTTGISVSGNFDAHIYNMHLNGLSGDAIYIQGDAAAGLEIHLNNITARANGGYGYHYIRTTTNDRGGVYLGNYQCIYDTQGAGGEIGRAHV